MNQTLQSLAVNETLDEKQKKLMTIYSSSSTKGVKDSHDISRNQGIDNASKTQTALYDEK